MSQKFLEGAIELVTKATEADKVSAACKETDEKNERARESVRAKVLEYMTRAEKIKKHLAEQSAQKASGASKAETVGANDENLALKQALGSTILMEKPDVKWSDVAGLTRAKEALQEAVIMPTLLPKMFIGKRKPWRGILLYGPPGTGKTYLAKAVATEAANSTFMSVSSSDLVSKWQGQSERLVKSMFDLARDHKPCIVFVDEVDSLCGKRGEEENESSRRIKTEFLKQMDGVGSDTQGILILGATNIPWVLDSAIRRRFEKRIYIPLPEESARLVMFRLHIGKTPAELTELNFKELAHRTDGFSGADIGIMCRDAILSPLRKVQQATHFRQIHAPSREDPSVTLEYFTPCSPGAPGAFEATWRQIEPDRLLEPRITMADMELSLARAKPSVAAEDLVELEEWTRKYGEEDGLPRYESNNAAAAGEKTREQILALGDPPMVVLLRACHMSDETILHFILEGLDYQTLLHHVSKADLALLVPKLGPRLRLWGLLCEKRNGKQGEENTAAGL